MTPIQALQTYFGYNAFRHSQGQVIDAVIEGKNVVVVMPTGGGKSLCYQIPALCLDGLTIVVSPLIALMKDQVDALQARNIPATFVNSTLSMVEFKDRIAGIREGKYKLLYVAPERFNDEEFMQLLSGVKIALFAVDEAHCISEWGHDFRPSFRRLKNVIVNLGIQRVLALTATATPQVREDIVKQLGLIDYELFVSGFDRPNLSFKVKSVSKQDKLYELLTFINQRKGSAGVIYAGTRQTAEEIKNILDVHDINALFYHGGMPPEERKQSQEVFMNGQCDVIVATNAFGMGIDKSDIRYVVHYDMPGSIEAYYQEAGRAGRDGKPSECLLLYNAGDRYLQEFFIKGDNPSRQTIQEVYDILQACPTEPVLMTYSEIKEEVTETVPEMSIGAALKLLEKSGYIELKGDNQKEGFIKFKQPFFDIVREIGARAKKKAEVLDHLYTIFDDALLEGVSCPMEQIIEKSGIKKDAFTRSLRELAKADLIEYEPPFRGKEIYIKQRLSSADITLDWSALEKKLEQDLSKLNAMEGYIYYPHDKREYVLKYFGEKGGFHDILDTDYDDTISY